MGWEKGFSGSIGDYQSNVEPFCSLCVGCKYFYTVTNSSGPYGCQCGTTNCAADVRRFTRDDPAWNHYKGGCNVFQAKSSGNDGYNNGNTQKKKRSLLGALAKMTFEGLTGR